MNKYLLLIIVIAAVIIRFLSIGSNPPSLTWDEAAWGYNAYTLGIDGRDEFGRFLPYDYLESFGDFKPPVYAYLDIIPVKVFGLNEFSTRFPSAFFGVFTVLVTYFLVKRIFFNSKHKELLGLASSAILAFSPWHIMLSRAGFEANVASFFIVSGIWLFLGAIQDKKWYLPLSAISFVLSMYTFNSARVVAPLIVLLLGTIFLRRLLREKKIAIISLLIGVIFILPITGFLLSPQASLRFKEVNIFSNPEIVKTANAEIANDHNAWWSKIIHNRRVGYAKEYVHHYFDNLSFQFLFIRGDSNVKFSIQDVGQLYLWEFPFFIGGILLLIKKKEGYWWLIPIWLLLAIIPAATARETPHALRTESALPTFQIFVAYGLSYFLIFIYRLRDRYVLATRGLVLILSLFVTLNISYFFHSYIVHYPRLYSSEWQYGYRDAIMYVKSVEDNYNEIRFTDELGRPYVYFLYYLAEFSSIDPQFFRQNADIKRDVFGFVHVNGFSKYRFGSVQVNNKEDKKKRILFINIAKNVPDGVQVLKRFNLVNGQPALVAYRL